LTQHALTGRGHALLARARAEQDALAGHFRALVEGFKDLKLSRERREAFLNDSIRAASARVRDGNTAGLAVFAAVGGWGHFLYFGFIGFVLFALPALVAVPRDALAASVLTLLFAFSPLDGVLGALPLLGRASASLARVEALGLSLDAAGAEEAGGPEVTPPATLDAPIVLRGVTYAYPRERGGEGFTLGPVDLTVRPGEVLFLVGGNGSGKTTLVKLLTGLYPPDAGTIRLGARAVDGASLDAYRGLFTAVFADGFVFGTLPGRPDPGRDERARARLAALGLDGVVTVEGGAFSTTRLSQGQLKRLALAAAWLEDRPVLVLDEWASYQDPRFKRAFYRTVLPALKAEGKTLVVISHDDAYFDAADRVVHLSGGVVDAPGRAGAAAARLAIDGPTDAPVTTGTLP
jgi:putative ATP-binding cassette transporter